MKNSFETLGGRQVVFLPELDFTVTDQLLLDPVLEEGLSVRFQSTFLPIHWRDSLYPPVLLEFEAVFNGKIDEYYNNAWPNFDVSVAPVPAAKMTFIGNQAIRGFKESEDPHLIYAPRHIADTLKLDYPTNYLPDLGKIHRNSLHYLLPEQSKNTIMS